MGTHHNYGASTPSLAAPEHAELIPQSTTPADGPALRGKDENEHADCAAFNVGRNAVITMIARAAQAGFTLHELASGGYLLCRWGMTKELPRLRAVGDLLRRIGSAS